MGGDNETVRRVEAAVGGAAAGKRLVLAVSGGRDSMALMHAAARACPGSVRCVASFDHGTGTAATDAVDLVAREAMRLGFAVAIGRSALPGASEATWRHARLGFLESVVDEARAHGEECVVATAHTRDDQAETVLMRILRGAGARGIAGLYAPSSIRRPLLDFSRDEVASYAKQVGATWAEDPTNVSRRFFRNRVRLDLLPALAKASPGFDDELIALSRKAAAWRADLESVVEQLVETDEVRPRVSVAAPLMQGYSRDELAVLWPAIAGRVGLAMDWRGTERAAAFTNRSRVGARIPLSGGWEIARSRERLELRRAS
jgi:tRNA(Ile)-lysidine synthase